MKIDAYYDITCCHCGRSRSSDFEKGMEISKNLLRRVAAKEGWMTDKETKRPVCPDCYFNVERNHTNSN